MAAKEWQGLLVSNKGSNKAYKDILQKLGIDDIVEIELPLGPSIGARIVGNAVGLTNKKPLIIGLGHHLMAYVGDSSVDYVYFDAHSDDNVNEDNSRFDCSTFIHYMDGRHYVVGIGEGIHPRKDITKWFKHDEAEKIIEQTFRNNIFLSYDIDVFDSTVTKAHSWGDSGRMFPDQVKDLSLRIVGERNLIGLNVASYNPSLESNQDYKTVDIIVDLLKPLI